MGKIIKAIDAGTSKIPKKPSDCVEDIEVPQLGPTTRLPSKYKVMTHFDSVNLRKLC